MRRYLPPVVAAVVLTATLQATSPAAADHDPGAQSVQDWNRVAVDTLRSFTGSEVIPAPVHAVYLAYVHRAVYDAVDHLPPPASFSAAVTAAAHDVLSHYFPSRQTTLDAAYELSLQASNGRSEALGLAFGERAARKLITERQGDGLNGPALPLPDDGLAGTWQPIPSGPFAAAASWLGNMEPFVLRSASQVRPGPHPTLASARWVQDYNEVRRLGGSATPPSTTERNAAQTDTALLWGEAPAMQSQRALRGFAEHATLDGEETARLFALANTASADSLIACAEAKFFYNFWRPVGAIRGIPADDGNFTTELQPGWASSVPTPNFPEYPSNHSCTTTAIARVVDALDGDEDFSVTVTRGQDDAPPIYIETFDSADEMIESVANGRVWGGLHYRFSTDAGTQIGNAVAAKVLRVEG
jgi:hypothetical protein